MIKQVKKHWGSELWIADGKETPYALKRIFFKSGNRTSLQVHKFKHETNYVLSGTGNLYISKESFNVDRFLSEGMDSEELFKYESTLQLVDLYKGVVFHVKPGYVHRVVALSDLEFIEASTCELDDVIRLQDDFGRNHGTILSEHN